MFDDWDVDWNHVGIAVLLWALCLLMIWKFFDQSIMKFYIKLILTVVMLPLCYGIIYLFARTGD